MSQRSRRTDPYPWTWEPAMMMITLMVSIMIIGLHLARSLANGTTGGHWSFAELDAWLTTAPALLRGDANAGLHLSPGTVAAPPILWAATVVVELLLLSVVGLLLRRAGRRWGPGRPRGFATPRQVDTVLGKSRLHRSATHLRPDLHRQSTRTLRRRSHEMR